MYNNRYELDGSARVANTRKINPTVFTESNLITVQPRMSSLLDVNSIVHPRIPIPSVYSINAPTSPTTFIPRTGLDFLQGLASIHIQQTFELNDIHSTVSSENRFTVRTPTNDAIYAASESSNASDRACYRSSRPFAMHLLDKTHQEALTLHRRLPFSCLCCYLRPQCLEIWQPPGNFLGTVRERFSLTANDFLIENHNKELLYLLEGPPHTSCYFPNEAHFRVMSGDSLTQKGTISRTWLNDVSSFCFNIYFSNSELDVKHKALLLGAGFLLEYNFFQDKWCC